MIRSVFFNLGLLVVALGISFWAMGSLRAMKPIATVTSEPAMDPLPRIVDFPLPTSKIQKEVVSEAGTRQQGHHLLDLNQASAGELEALPGVGAVLAQRVIAFRTAAGGFQTVDDLREVKGIGSKKFDRLKALVTVSTSESHILKQRKL